MRNTKRMLAALAALAVAASASAGAQGHPQTRQGFWIGFGPGAGQATPDCSGCSTIDAEQGSSGFLRMGGRLGPRWLLGGEINSWVGSFTDPFGDNFDVAGVFISPTAYFYPTATSGLFIKGGIGSYAFAGEYDDGTTVESAATMILLGVGYDIRVSRMISITPVLTILQSQEGDLDVDGVTQTGDFKVRWSRSRSASRSTNAGA